MSPEESIERIKGKVGEIAGIARLPRFSPEYKKWHRETSRLLEMIFGKGASQVKDFEAIRFVYNGIHVLGDGEPFDRRFQAALKEAAAILTSMHEEIAEFGVLGVGSDRANPLSVVETICSRFHAVARQLRARHGSRPTLEVQDEYDVQDLLHSLLRVHFDDIRPEEWTPSYAGAASRMDFLLKDESVVVEVKKTRSGLRDKDVGDQLIVDIARYKEHPGCKTLVCFVYDPDGWIGNPVALKKDLEKRSEAPLVKVLIFPETK